MAGGASGHVSLGLAFFLIGLWHLFSSIRLHSLRPASYLSLAWFPVPRARYLEPAVIIAVTVIFILMEIFVGRGPIFPIQAKSLRHLEHSIVALSFAVYACFAVLLERMGPPAKHGLLHFLQAAAFGQQLLILHLHSTDHMGIEGQYHWLLQIVTSVTLLTTVLAIGYPGSFMNSFVRGFSVVFQGVWLIVTGVMLWTPEWMPKGCFMRSEMGRDAVLCHGDRALEQAKALVNLQFGLYLIVLTAFSVGLYLVVIKLYPQETVEYRPLTKCQEQEEGGHYDVGTHNINHKICISRTPLPM